MSSFSYVGSELDLFSAAVHWKRYWGSRVSRFLGRRVLEIGAGFGGTTRLLATSPHERWVCVEPDPALTGRLRESITRGELPPYCETALGTIEQLPPDEKFDSILYIDVLEHIEDDAAEFARAAARLAPGGHLVVLCPAHRWLFTKFDAAIGHYRRYTKRMFARLTTAEVELVRLEYLDSVGLLASLANRLLLRQSLPTPRQIALWDNAMVPVSRGMDSLTFHCLGKSVLGIWRRKD